MSKSFPLLFILLWSSAFITTLPIVQNSDPFSALAFRFFLVAICFFIYSIYKKTKISVNNKDLVNSLGTGILFHGLYLGGVFYSIYIGSILRYIYFISDTDSFSPVCMYDIWLVCCWIIREYVNIVYIPPAGDLSRGPVGSDVEQRASTYTHLLELFHGM